jgi:hypothetical protein
LLMGGRSTNRFFRFLWDDVDNSSSYAYREATELRTK